MNHTEYRVAIGDGLKLNLRDYPAQGEARGLPVICLHGLTRNIRDFEDVAPRIAALGRRVLVMEMRGRGKSDYDPDPVRYRPDVYANDVLLAMKAVEVPRAVFLGTSMGGVITMILAATAAPCVGAAILNDVGPRLAVEGLKRIGNYVGASDDLPDWNAVADAVKRTQSPAFPKADEAFWAAFARRVAEETPDGRRRFSYDPAIAKSFSFAAPPDLTGLFLALAMTPVLVVRGAISDVLSPEGLAHMKTVKPDLAIAEVPDVGHAPMLDEPAAWKAIEEFLSRVS